MKYCGIDLHSNNAVVAVSDKQDRVRTTPGLNGDFYQVLSFSDRDADTVAALKGPPGARYNGGRIGRSRGGAKRNVDSSRAAVRANRRPCPTPASPGGGMASLRSQ